MLFRYGAPAKTPGLLKSIFKKRVWSLPKGNNCVYLTFDDGPTPGVTDWVLDILKSYNIKATFFCIGKNVTANPEIYDRIIREGHRVGNHTHNHLNGWKTNTPEYLQNVAKASEVINSKLFRPPYGKTSLKQASSLHKKGYKIIMWDVLAIDWDKSLTSKKCYKNVMDNTEDGSIIVFHDSIKASKNLKKILPGIIKDLSGMGYSFGVIPLE